jgi:hypothetical protein
VDCEEVGGEYLEMPIGPIDVNGQIVISKTQGKRGKSVMVSSSSQNIILII